MSSPRRVHSRRRPPVVALLAAMAVRPTLAGLAGAGGFDRAIDRVVPRVVKLYGLGAGLQAGYGTGVIVSEDGLVLTVLSLLIDGPTVRAVTSDATQYEADVLYRDPARQLALLRLRLPAGGPGGAEPDGAIKAAASLPFFDLARRVDMTPGDWVLAAGNPFKVASGAEPVSIAHGVFSTCTHLDATRRVKDFPYYGEVLVIDAVTSNPGAPGGALVNLDGEFLGMIGREVESNLTGTAFNYAVPRDVLYAFLREATDPQHRPPVAEAPADDTTDPVDPGIRLARTGYLTVLPFVERVRRDSPAERAGIRKDDLILSVNGRAVPDVDTYDDRLHRLRPGEPIDLVVRRGRAIVRIRIEPQTPWNP